MVHLECLLRDLFPIQSCSQFPVPDSCFVMAINLLLTSAFPTRFFPLVSLLFSYSFFPPPVCLSVGFSCFFSAASHTQTGHSSAWWGFSTLKTRRLDLFLFIICCFYYCISPTLYSPHSDSKELDRRRARIKHSEGGDIPPKYFVVTNNQLLRVKYLLVYSQKQPKR